MHSREETGGWVGGQEEMTGWRVGWGATFKNISNCRTQGRATAVQQHTFDFSYFCCFFHNVQSLPYKLMTKTLLQLKHKKTRWFSHCHFSPCVCQQSCFLSEGYLTYYQHYMLVSGVSEKPGNRIPASENNYTELSHLQGLPLVG